jgi:hypothetical protein
LIIGNRWPSADTSYDRWLAGVAYRVLNNSAGFPRLKIGPVVWVGIGVSAPDASRWNSSRPFRAHTGREPPPVETCHRPASVFGNGRT